LATAQIRDGIISSMASHAPFSRLFAFIGKCCLSALIASPAAVYGISFEKDFGNNQLYAELDDPYYFCSGAYLSLSKNPIPVLSGASETQVYSHLLSSAARPNSFLVEVGVYPLPLAGVAARSWVPNYYPRVAIAGVNLVRAFTESVNFTEPWSVSVFAGHVVSFKAEDSSVQGHGNIGLLCSYGYYHIKDNTLCPDHWGEFELKLKVDKGGKDLQYATSYRIGTHLHSSRDIRDIIYVCLRRERTDFVEKGFSLIRNTNFELRGDLSYQPLQVLSLSAEAGKKYPFKVGKHSYVVGLSLGLTWNINNPYDGALAEGFAINTVSPIIRPLLTF
jgi:hypothetical protein